ncbi:hypothetical protein SAMN05518800_6805 [Variovorax sp. YR752]|nr:hypothetical protein SAMN05518800_6805 [Variovorax sp. YR752]
MPGFATTVCSTEMSRRFPLLFAANVFGAMEGSLP